MDKLRAMTTFVSIAERGSLSAAAQAMGLSLPTVVRILAALEADVGVRLVNRTTRRLALTREGQSYLESCRNLLSALEETESALRDEAGEPSGQLTITAPVLFGQMHVAPAIAEFVRKYDKVRCSLVLADHVVDLLEERVDVGVRIGHLDDSSLIAQQVGRVRRVVVASPAYLAEFRRPEHPRQLLDANCISFSRAPQSWWNFEENGRGFTIPMRGNLEFSHVASAIEACLAGMGFGIFLSYQVAPYVADGRLEVILSSYEPSPLPVSIVYPHARLLPARTRVFVSWIAAELAARLEPALAEPSLMRSGA